MVAKGVLVLCLILGLTTLAEGGGVAKNIAKKRDRSLARIFNDVPVHSDAVVLSAEQWMKLSDKILPQGLYSFTCEDGQTGYYVLTSAMGRFESFQYLVVYEKDFTVKAVEVLNYASQYGAEICNRKWLRQFVGYREGTLVYGKDIQSVSGATISARSITHHIGELTRTLIDVVR